MSMTAQRRESAGAVGSALTGAARTVVAARAVNGECPQWDVLRSRLYWVDMRKPALHAWEPASSQALSWEMPAWIGCYGILGDGRLVVALRTGLYVFTPTTGALAFIAPAPYDPRRFCFNDGRCDRSGRLVIGLMAHPLQGSTHAGQPQFAPLWSWAGSGLSALSLPPVRISNGLAFSPDGRTLYHSDTAAKTIWACDWDEDSGIACNQRIFARIDEGGDTGGPDGATVDSDGCYICAVFGAGCLLRFDPSGRLERRFPLPVRYPTMPALGGDGLTTLYVTSASFPDQGDDKDVDDPFAGDLLALDAPAPGLPTAYMHMEGVFCEPDCG